jgi:hypothetical protein
MKHNKLLDVALNKTNRQTGALREFLKYNKLHKKGSSGIHSMESTKSMPNNVTIKEEGSREINNSTEYNI